MLIKVDVLLFSQRIQMSSTIISWQFTFNKHTADPTNLSTHCDLEKRRGGFKERQICFVFYSETIMDVCSHFYGLARSLLGFNNLRELPSLQGPGQFSGLSTPQPSSLTQRQPRSTEEKCLGRTNSRTKRVAGEITGAFQHGQYVWANQGVGLVWPFGSGWRVHADWKHSRRVVLVARLLSLGCSLYSGIGKRSLNHNRWSATWQMTMLKLPFYWLSESPTGSCHDLPDVCSLIKADRECNMAPCGRLQVKDVLDVFIDQVRW